MLAEVDERPALVGKLELDPADLAGIVAAGLLPQLVPQAYLALPDESRQNKLKESGLDGAMVAGRAAQHYCPARLGRPMPCRPKEQIARELLAVRQKIEPLLTTGNALREEMRALCEEERRSLTVDVAGKGKVECIWTPVGRATVNVTVAESS